MNSVIFKKAACEKLFVITLQNLGTFFFLNKESLDDE